MSKFLWACDAGGLTFLYLRGIPCRCGGNKLTPLKADFEPADSTRRVFLWLLPRGGQRYPVSPSIRRSLVGMGLPVNRTEQPIAARTVFAGEEGQCSWLSSRSRSPRHSRANASQGLKVPGACADLLIQTRRGEGGQRKAASIGVRNLSLAGAGLAFDGKDFAARLYRLRHAGEARSVAGPAGVFLDLGRHIEPSRPPQLGCLFPCGPPVSKGNDPSQGGLAGAVIPIRRGGPAQNHNAFDFHSFQSASFPRTRAADLPAFDSRAPSGLSAPPAFKHMKWRSQQDSNLQPTE